MNYKNEPYFFDDEILSLLQDLTGPGGELIIRWGSLELRFPREHDLANTIWKRIIHPTPNLTTLRLFGLQHLDNRDALPRALVDLSTLQNFYIEDVEHWGFLSCLLPPFATSRSKLTSRTALQLSRFHNLKSLKILCEDVNWSHLPSDAGPTCITLPRLQELTLVAPFEHLTKSDFNLPSLKHLFLVCSYKDSPKQLPSLHPIFVVWNPSQRLVGGKGSFRSVRLESILRDLLGHFTIAADLAVPASKKLALLGLLTKILAEGTLPHNWETVSFHKEEEIVETVAPGVRMANAPTDANISRKIEKTLKLLDKENKRVEELENLLGKARKKCMQLKQELASYRTTVTSINSCPAEILCSIFNYSISSDRTLIYHLLLVCKHWHALVVNDPQMWNVIHLSIPEFEWNLYSWADSIRPFVLRCLKLSRFALLHITLDFVHLRSPREQIINRLESGFMDVPIDMNPLSLWLEGLDYDDLESDDEITGDCQPDPVLDLIELLVGNNGEHMERWGSLELSFPIFSAELAFEIWDRIQFPVPNLSRVHLYELSLLNDFEDEDPLPIAMPKFSQVQHLKISELTNWRCLSFFPPSIQSLSVHTTMSNCRSLDLSPFTHLRSLTLRRGYLMQGGPEIPDLNELPFLRDLSLIGYFAHLDKVKWNIPSLRSLTLSWRYETPEGSLPDLQPLLIRWSPFNRSTCDGALHHAARVIQNLLLHFTNAQDLAVAVHEKAVVLKVLRRLFWKNLLPPRWETVSFHNGEEILETMSIQRVIKRIARGT